MFIAFAIEKNNNRYNNKRKQTLLDKLKLFYFFRLVVYKRRQYLTLEPATTFDKRTSGVAHRKRIAYTELKDMSND